MSGLIRLPQRERPGCDTGPLSYSTLLGSEYHFPFQIGWPSPPMGGRMRADSSSQRFMLA